ncbi:MAG TPA: ATP-binding protein [Limnochordales bacterium]
MAAAAAAVAAAAAGGPWRLTLAAGAAAGLGTAAVLSERAWRTLRAGIGAVADALAEMARGRPTQVLVGEPDELADVAQRLRDLSERIATAIQHSTRREAQLAGVLGSLVDGCIAVDAGGRVILFNQAASRLFGRAAADVLGRPVMEAIRSYDLATAIGETLATGRQQMREFRVPGPEERILQVTATPLAPPARAGGAGGSDPDRPEPAPGAERWGAVALVRDVTELRRLERVRSDFVANVSHELRTPLTALKGFIEALQEGAAEDPATRTRFLEIMARETDRLVALINDLLDLSHLESRNVELRRAPVSLPELAGAVIAMFARKAAAKNLALEQDLPADLPPVLGDEDMLRQVFINLLDNAVKYTPSGRITVRARAEPQQPTVRVEVADTGIGIPRQHLGRIFERFYRVDRARSRELGGTGLGLSIVRHIVELHGGRIEVESEVGVGTTFRFWLPRAP